MMKKDTGVFDVVANKRTKNGGVVSNLEKEREDPLYYTAAANCV